MNWSAEQRLLMLWQVTPARVREPDTQRELAALLGLHETTLSRWSALPGWMEAKNSMIMRRLMGKMPDIVNCWIEDLISGPDLWQARRDFFRFAMPFLAGVQSSDDYKAISDSEIGALPASSIEDDLTGLSASERARFLGILEKVGAIQAGSMVADMGGALLIDAKLLPSVEKVPVLSLNEGAYIDAAVAGLVPGRKLAGKKKRSVPRKRPRVNFA